MMKVIIHRDAQRGKSEHGWLSSRFSFSFADWYESARMGFGALRVINDDTIAPSSGFPMHAHSDMEIITIVNEGTVTHKDNLGNSGETSAGEVQAMSAGTGIVHSEYNASANEPLKLFQIWIQPNEKGVIPRYAQKTFRREAVKPGLRLLVAPDAREGALPIHQDAYLYEAHVAAKHPVGFILNDASHGAYCLVIEGEASIAGEKLKARDAIGISGAPAIKIESSSAAALLIIEVPLSGASWR